MYKHISWLSRQTDIERRHVKVAEGPSVLSARTQDSTVSLCPVVSTRSLARDRGQLFPSSQGFSSSAPADGCEGHGDQASSCHSRDTGLTRSELLVTGILFSFSCILEEVLLTVKSGCEWKVVYESWMSYAPCPDRDLCCGVMCNSHCLGKVIVLILPGQTDTGLATRKPPAGCRLCWAGILSLLPSRRPLLYEHYGIVLINETLCRYIRSLGLLANASHYYLCQFFISMVQLRSHAWKHDHRLFSLTLIV